MALKCQKCGSEWTEELSQCPVCGAAFVGSVPEPASSGVRCSICTHTNDRDATYCVKCGSNLRVEEFSEPIELDETNEEMPTASLKPSWLAGILHSFDIGAEQWKVSLILGIIIFGLLALLLTAASDVCCSAFFLLMFACAVVLYWLSFGRKPPA